MRIFIFLFVFLSGNLIFAQDLIYNENKTKIDSLYREDQFFIGITYNSLLYSPTGYSNDKISLGFTGGFLRDMPINKKRTFAIAAGIGLTQNSYNHNFGVSGTGEKPIYTILEGGTYSKNRFSTYSVDFPFELRWRNSTFESTKFSRIYAGFKLSYLFYDRNIYQSSSGNATVKNNIDLNKLGYGVYLASGYNTFNVYVHYRVNSLFQSGEIGTEKIALRNLNVGVLFYIL